MITSVFLYILYAVVFLITSPLRLFNNVSRPTWLVNTLGTINSSLSFGYSWLPMTIYALLLTWGLFVSIEISIFGYKGIMWVLKKIPGIN